MGIQIRLEGLDDVIGKLNNMANGANSGLQRGLMQELHLMFFPREPLTRL